MAVTDKLLNGSGLSHLASTIKGELADKQDTLTAGSGISIVNNVISATGGGGGGLPEYPSQNGNYSLIVTVNGQTQTLSWNPISSVWELPTKINNDLRVFQAVVINKINNGLEVY